VNDEENEKKEKRTTKNKTKMRNLILIEMICVRVQFAMFIQI
jgi:hypothetical protein